MARSKTLNSNKKKQPAGKGTISKRPAKRSKPKAGRIAAPGSIDKEYQYLALLSESTRAILLSGDLDSILHDLAKNMAMLMEADDCYIALWDEERQLTLPRATTARLEKPYESTVESSEPNLTASVLKAGRALVAEDVFNSPYLNPEIANRYPARSVMGVPLIARNHGLGAVIIAYNSHHHFTLDEIERAEHAASHIAAAIWSAQQDIEIKKRLNEQRMLAHITTALSQTELVGLSNLLKLIVDSSRELITDADEAVIHLIDQDKSSLIPKAVSGFEGSGGSRGKMRIGEGVAGQAVIAGKSIYIPDITNDERFLNLNAAVNYRSLLVTPVSSGGQTHGTISIQSRKKHAFSKNDINLLNELGQQAAIAIDNARLIESTRQALRETNALYRISRGLLALDAEELLDDAVNLLEKNLGFHLVQVYLVEPASGDLILKAASGETGKKLKEQNHRLKAGSGIVGYVAEMREPFFTNDVDRVIFHIKNPLRPDMKSEMAVPIQVGDQLLGVLDFQQSETSLFHTHDLQLASIVADQLAASLQKSDLYESLQKSLQKEKAIRNQLVQNERLAIMGRLLASVSHELNNPLQAIQNALFLLKGEKGISAQGRKDLEIVIAESERMAGLIERLRNTYRPTQAEDLQPTDINNIIEDVYALLAAHLRKNKVVFEFHPDREMPVIMAQPDQIRQVALNLMVNAVDAMTEGGKLTVSSMFLRETREALFSVSDTGAGISPAILPHIFDPFVTNKKQGTGIGLTISHDIVVKHGGRIAAENNAGGRGATFKVWLPVDAAPAGTEWTK